MADQRITYLEEMVGFNHPTKADTLNRIVMVDHNNDGTHRKLPFHATRGGVDQTGIVTATWTRLSITAKEFDPGNIVDTTLYKVTPNIPGKYLLSGQITFNGMTAGTQVGVGIFKNTIAYKELLTNTASTGQIALPISCVVDANGTDYYEIYAYQSSGVNQTILGNTVYTYFTGCRID